MRLLCTGDLHISDLPSLGPERLAEQEQVWRRCLEIGREYEVDAVLFAGDAWEGRRPTPDEFLAFERPLVYHRGHSPVYAIVGNHDLTHAEAGCGLDVLAEAGLLELYRRPGWDILLGHPLGNPSCGVAFLPWAPVSRLVAATDGADRNQVNQLAAEALVETARGLREQIDGPAILLTHFAIEGAALPSGGGVEEHMREPILPIHDLEEIGFDAIVAGHIHAPQILGAVRPVQETAGAGLGEKAPAPRPQFYVGSPLPLNFGEANCKHGIWLLDTDGWTFDFIEIENTRLFDTLNVPDDLVARLADEGDYEEFAMFNVDDGAYMKVRYTATAEQARRIDPGALRASLLEAGAHRVWVEPTIVRKQRARVEGLTDDLDDEAALLLYLDSIGITDENRRGVLVERHRRFTEA
jgi:DNA repair exonuclease SbcCD nuclease subunit